LIENQSQQTVWKWDQDEPFCVNVPSENPEGLGAFEFPLRFPGQYFDKETNLHYNYFRDCYDPATGRFCQPDPAGTLFLGEMGLRSLGSLGLLQPNLGDLLFSNEPRFNHLYLYVENRPINFVDPKGLGPQQGDPNER
jgi:RHS repeat-associated protein